MRLRLNIRPIRDGLCIPINYSYYLSTIIYRWIKQSSQQYSAFLHKQGFSVEGTNRRFKHFCFSNLIIPRRKITNSQLQIFSPQIGWYIGMPVEETLKHLVVGIFEKQEFFIEDVSNSFIVEQVEILPEPHWQRTMKFRMLSPVTISIPEERNGKWLPHYLRPDDDRLRDAFRNNVLNKYHSLNNFKQEDEEFDCTLDEKFISDRGGPEKISKLLTIKQGQNAETKVRGFICPLTITGNSDLIKLAYESGLGEKSSLGFGMIKAV